MTKIKLGGAVLFALAVLAACSRPVVVDEPVRSVRVVTVAPAVLQARTEYAGEVRSQVESRLGFRVAGKLIRRQAELGQHVRRGAVLAQLDIQDYKLVTDSAQAQLDAANTNRDLAAADFKRYKDLRDQNFISSAELDRREATLKAAQAQVDQARAALASQGNQQSYTSLVADSAGIVTSVEAEPGQVVAAGAIVLRVAQDGPRDVVFSVPEDKVGYLRTGMGVDVKPWGSSTSLRATIREIAASADPVTRTFAIKVALPGTGALALGTTVTVVPDPIQRVGASAITLPTSALRQDGAKVAVWRLDRASMTVNLVPVELATADGNDVVIASGLNPGDLVVTAGVHVLSPGQKVTIYKEPAGAGATPDGAHLSAARASASAMAATPAK
jgi:RND family efflux transporter MFP subunit